MGYVVGVDGGGTKTAAVVLAEPAGQIAGRGLAGPGNSRSAGAEAASHEIARAITAALHDATIALEQVDAVCLCLAGFDTDLDLPVPQRVIALLGYQGPAIFENDVVGAWAGATEAAPGVVVIAGTGSTALGMNTRGQFWRSGGWDYVLGDEGSAYAIGLDGIRAAIRTLDGRASVPTRLALALRQEYDIESVAELRRRWDEGHLGKLEIAAFAEQVARVAHAEHDATARQILLVAAAALAEHVEAIIGQLHMGGEAFPVCSVGGVFASTLVAEAVRERLAAFAPRATFVEPAAPPEVGAARLARARLDAGDLGSWTLGTGGRTIQRSVPLSALFPETEVGR